MNGLNEYREVGFVKVEKRSCSVNYSVNMIVAGDERCVYVDENGNKINDHGMSDIRLYQLLGDVKEVVKVTDKYVEVKISEVVSARIYQG